MKKFTEAFDGLMLGDGCITKSKMHKNYHYAQPCNYLEWVINIKNLFISNGFNSTISEVKPNLLHYIPKPNYSYTLQSNYIEFFTNQHNRWYIKDYNIDEYPKSRWHLNEKNEEYFAWHKTVPKDISLTPECILNWYLGDGSLINPKYYNHKYISIATCSFYESELEHLVFLLNDQVVDCAYFKKSDNYIQISTNSGVKSFFNYINYLDIPNCYYYKFIDEVTT